MKIVVLTVRLLGLVFLVFGLNAFLQFLKGPIPGGLAGQFLQALFQSHYARYVMFAANLVEYFLRRTGASVGHILKSLADTFSCIGASRNVEQSLISFGVLDNGFHRQYHGALLFFSCFMKSPERRRKVVSDWMSFVMSSMGPLRVKAPF